MYVSWVCLSISLEHGETLSLDLFKFLRRGCQKFAHCPIGNPISLEHGETLSNKRGRGQEKQVSLGKSS